MSIVFHSAATVKFDEDLTKEASHFLFNQKPLLTKSINKTAVFEIPRLNPALLLVDLGKNRYFVFSDSASTEYVNFHIRLTAFIGIVHKGVHNNHTTYL